MNALEPRPTTNFTLEERQENIIKVIGVGGGGGNALNYMYKMGVKGVDYIVCNTDVQDLTKSPVLQKVQIGIQETKGLGAGAEPEVGEKAALENIADIERFIEGNTEMVFVTAGMGGGTGTGAAPVIAKLCKDKGILTVGIVTTPFDSEGSVKVENARKGIEKLKECVDSLIIVNNNKMCEIYGDLPYRQSFAKSNEILSNAARGIAEIISKSFYMNIDMRDARKVLSNSGTALMGVGRSTGKGRLENAMRQALDSPLLDDNRIAGAKGALLLITHGEEEPTILEVDAAQALIQHESENNATIILGMGEDTSLDADEVVVTLIATGFKPNVQREHLGKEPDRLVVSMAENEQNTAQPIIQEVGFELKKSFVANVQSSQVPQINKVQLSGRKSLDKTASATAVTTPLRGEVQQASQLEFSFDATQESKETSVVRHNIGSTNSKLNEVKINEDRNIPAHIRKKLMNAKFQQTHGISSETLNFDASGMPVIRHNHSYIDDNVD